MDNFFKCKDGSLFVEEYGHLEWLPTKEYYKGNWAYVASVWNENESYDIVEKDMEFRYTQI